MTIAPFSSYIFWSYKSDADLSDSVIIRQVIAYGEISDFLLVSKLFSHEIINRSIESWKSRNRYKKQINFLIKVFLND